MIEFADARDEIASLPKCLWQADGVGDVFAKLRGVFEDLGGVRSQSGQERGSRRVAQGILTVGAIEPDAAGRQAVDVGRLHPRISIAAEPGIQIVRDNVQDIEPDGVGGEAERLERGGHQ